MNYTSVAKRDIHKYEIPYKEIWNVKMEYCTTASNNLEQHEGRNNKRRKKESDEKDKLRGLVETHVYKSHLQRLNK